MKLKIEYLDYEEKFINSLDYSLLIGERIMNKDEDWLNYITIYVR